ncbi:putative RNA methyltransferase [Drosera capensis]
MQSRPSKQPHNHSIAGHSFAGIVIERLLAFIRTIQLLQKALPIRVITVGKNRSHGTQLLVDEYAGKLNYYCRFEDHLVRSNPKNAHDVLAQIEGEDMAVMNLIKPNDMVVVLDEVGENINSKQMADLIGDAGSTGAWRLVFCIGGPYGHGIQSRKRANKMLKLSSLTLNHQIALVVLMEQLYRAWTILKGQKYHH